MNRIYVCWHQLRQALILFADSNLATRFHYPRGRKGEQCL